MLFLIGLLLAALLLGCGEVEPEHEAEGERWLRGNLHTHSLWSDGDEFPEVVAAWYKDAGYDFLVVSDHNEIQAGERWIAPAHNRFAARSGGMEVYESYRERFGEDWVETRTVGDTLQVRLKPFEEYRPRLEEPGEFLLVRGEEITDEQVIHVNATNLERFIPPQGGETPEQIIRQNVEAVLDQREELGRPMFPHVNHPNFHYAVTAEDLAAVEPLRFFEVFNGHRGVNNHGDEDHLDLDRLWDVALTLRLEAGYGLLYGVAVDDAHNYSHSSASTAEPGRGWVMVRASELSAESIVEAMEAGAFYATTGVRIEEISFTENQLRVKVEPEEGVDYRIRFIGTPRELEPGALGPARDSSGGGHGENGGLRGSYGEEIGQVLKEAEGPEARYELSGEERYVRAKVISSKPHPNPFAEGDLETAWIQPVRPE